MVTSITQLTSPHLDLAADRAELLADGPHGPRKLPQQLLHRVRTGRSRKVQVMAQLAEQRVPDTPADQIELVSGLVEQFAQAGRQQARSSASSATAAACTELSWKVDTLSDCNAIEFGAGPWILRPEPVRRGAPAARRPARFSAQGHESGPIRPLRTSLVRALCGDANRSLQTRAGADARPELVGVRSSTNSDHPQFGIQLP